MFPIREENKLLVPEGSHIEQDMPGFFFRKHQWNKGGHIRSRTSVLENPEQFAIRPSRLPGPIGEIPRELADKTWNIS